MRKLIVFGLLHFFILKGFSQVYTIPVVVHVLHMGGPENISDAQVIRAIDILNEDYRKLNADTVDIASIFVPIAADLEIEFCLASVDPSGNSTTGIEHIFSSYTNDGANPAAKINQWPRHLYFNIWVVENMGLTNPGGVATITQPDSVDLTPAQDGLVYLHDYMGDIGTSNYFKGRALTHHIGHFFNLKDINADSIGIGPSGICGDDDVLDTPISTYYGAPPVCDTTSSSCNPPIIENVQNFMNLNPCGRMFTEGQKVRARACLNDTIADRNNLWTAWNLGLTGCGPLDVHDIINQSLIKIIPNPASEYLEIVNLPNGKYEILITDMIGRVVQRNNEVKAENNKSRLNLTNLYNPGVYLLVVQSDDRSFCFKFIKE